MDKSFMLFTVTSVTVISANSCISVGYLLLLMYFNLALSSQGLNDAFFLRKSPLFRLIFVPFVAFFSLRFFEFPPCVADVTAKNTKL